MSKACETCGERPCDHVIEAIGQLDEQIAKLTCALEMIARGGYECDTLGCTELATRLEPDDRSVCREHASARALIDFPTYIEELQKVAREALGR